MPTKTKKTARKTSERDCRIKWRAIASGKWEIELDFKVIKNYFRDIFWWCVCGIWEGNCHNEFTKNGSKTHKKNGQIQTFMDNSMKFLNVNGWYSCGCEKPKILCKKCSKFSLFNVCRHYLAIFSRDVCEKHRVCVFGDLISSKLWFMCVKWENFTLWKYKKSHLMLFTVKSLQFDKESPTRDSKFFFCFLSSLEPNFQFFFFIF